MPAVQYLTDLHPAATFGRKPAPRFYSATGYGSKIPTDRVVRLNGRTYRVYVIQYSNAGSAYVRVKGQRLFLRDGDGD